MPIQHINRRGQTFYLHQGLSKTGKPKYFFSMKSEGPLVEEIPTGFEIYENPNAQVFLRRIQPKIITDEEMRLVEQGIKQFSKVKYYQLDIKKNAILIYEANQDVGLLIESLSFAPKWPKSVIGTNTHLFADVTICASGPGKTRVYYPALLFSGVCR